MIWKCLWLYFCSTLLVHFAIPADWRVKRKSEMFKEITGPCLRVKNALEYEGNCNINHSWSTQNNPQEPRKGNVGTRKSRKVWDYPDHSTNEISKYTLKNPRELRRLAVTQIPVKTTCYYRYEKFTWSKIIKMLWNEPPLSSSISLCLNKYPYTGI